MSNSERPDDARPDIAAFKELEKLIHVLGSEMAGWRRRAQLAETRLKEGGGGGGAGGRDGHSGVATGREAELKKENAELRRRLNAARVRTQQLLDRVRFLRQQHEMELDR